MEGVIVFAGLIILVVLPVAILVWINQKQSLGTIRCSRCHYTGPPGGKWAPFKGIVPTCPKCGSDNWVRVETEQS
jgi:hypothetical protein